MTLLVTGGAGFLGLNILEACLVNGECVVAMGDRPIHPAALQHLGTLPGTLHVVVANVCSPGEFADVLVKHAVTKIIHGAAITPAPTWTAPPCEAVIDSNVVSTAMVAEAAVHHGIERVIYPSSSAVYGVPPFGTGALREEDPTIPYSLYGFSKLAAERILIAANRTHGLPVAIARITAAFGPWEHESAARRVVSPPFQLVQRVLDGRAVRIPPGGSRDWTWSRDVASALLKLVQADVLPNMVYNVSSGEPWHLRRLAEALSTRFERELTTIEANESAGEGADEIAFHDADHVCPPLCGERISRDVGMAFMPASAAIANYADWVCSTGRSTFAQRQG